MFKTTLRPTQPPILWVPSSFPTVNLQVCNVNHQPLPTAEVRKEWIYTSTPPLGLHGVD
jgi:hypothetical protein